MHNTHTQPIKRGGFPKPSHRFKAKRLRETGRLRANTINLARLREYASLGMIAEEIADRLHVDTRWLQAQKQKDPAIEEAWLNGWGDLIESLRRAQLKLALSGHPGMLIWLGKQFLGQSDKSEQKQEVAVNVVLQNAVKELRALDSETIMEMKRLLEAPKEHSMSEGNL